MKSGIRDNRNRGKVADFLKEKAASGSHLSIVSAYFTIYAYEALSEQLDGIDSLKFLFGEPKFIQRLDPEKTDKKAFRIEDEGLTLTNRLQQKEVARRCAQWITNKVEIRSIREANLMHGKLYHIDDGRREHALMAIRPQQVRAVNHDQLAGLQIADAVASSLFFAVNLTQFGEVEDRYFRMLRPTIYRHAKSGELGYGLKFWPGGLETCVESMTHLTSFLPPR